MQSSRSRIIYLKKSIALQSRVSLPLICMFLMPISAWAGNSTAGLVYLFLPFIYTFAFFLIGTSVSLGYLITCVFRAKQNSFMDIEQTNIFKQKLFWIWKVATLIWIAVIFFVFLKLDPSVETLFFAAIYMVIPSALVGMPLYFFVAIRSRFSR